MPGAETATLVRHRYGVVRAATRAQHRGTIGDVAFQRVEEELDWAELGWARLVQAGEREDGAG